MNPWIYITVSVVGWIFGFLTAVLSNWYLERRRAFRSIRCACDSVDFRLTEPSATEDFHKWSIDVLEAPFFTGVGFLNYEDRKSASVIWSNYIGFDLTKYPEDDFMGVMNIHLGLASTTRGKAIQIEIEKIRSLFDKLP
jgi:hypothetical protein